MHLRTTGHPHEALGDRGPKGPRGMVVAEQVEDPSQNTSPGVRCFKPCYLLLVLRMAQILLHSASVIFKREFGFPKLLKQTENGPVNQHLLLLVRIFSTVKGEKKITHIYCYWEKADKMQCNMLCFLLTSNLGVIILNCCC